MVLKVAILGAGVIGLSTGLCLKQSCPSLDVVLISKETSPFTCTDVAAGIWEPFVLRQTPMELQRKWSKATWDLAETLERREDASVIGISTCSGYNLLDCEMEELPEWHDLVVSMRKLTPKDLQKFPAKYKSGFFFTTYIIEGSKYLSWLTKCFTDLGGLMKTAKVDCFEQVADYDLVINCTGFGARELCNDTTIEPVRGQVMRVEAPWARHFYLADLTKENKVVYIIPNNDFVVLGGTVQQGNFSTDISTEDRDHILKETQLLKPDLARAKKLQDFVGLRPSRPSIRLEKENYVLRQNSFKKNTLKIVHNYGHGGAGLTVHWGCALDAVQLAKESLEDGPQNKIQAKL